MAKKKNIALPPKALREEVSKALLAWFEVHQRTLPWRSDPAPYRVWISEIMLQQTRVATVLPYFARWMERFPDVESLAEAELEDALALWAGLGYYRRARMLHRAAGDIQERFAGTLPRTVKELLSISGIGRYTAGAIASIAYNEPAPIVDGNVIRILCRIFGLEGEARSTPVQKQLWALAEALIPEGKARDFNQSMMELGALVCSPRSPSCSTCPVQTHCEAYRQDRVEELPMLAKAKAQKPMLMAALVVRDPTSNTYLFVQRPEEGLFGGLWAFPMAEVPGANHIEGHETHCKTIAQGLLDELGLDATPSTFAAPVLHILTHIRMVIQPLEINAPGASTRLVAPRQTWVPTDALLDFPLPTAIKKVVKGVVIQSSLPL